MQHKYKVKLLNGHTAKPTQIVNGYLGNSFNDGKVEKYSRGEAIKKAHMFGGVTEKIERTVLVKETATITLDENSLIFGVELLLKSWIPTFLNGSDKTQVIYKASVFQDILNDNSKLLKEASTIASDKVLNQLEELVDITANYDYVIIINRFEK